MKNVINKHYAKLRSTILRKKKSVVKKKNWEVRICKHNLQFIGLKDWKQEYNGELESVLFSSGKIKEFDETQFALWLNTLPSGARYRVRRRLLDGTDKAKAKWGNMGTWFLNWEKFKVDAQSEQRVLEEKVRQGDTSEETKEKLIKVKKEAKVNTGAEDLFTLFGKLTGGKTTVDEFNTNAQSILDKVKFEVPVLVIADRSSSMMSNSGGLPIKMAQLVTTLTMLKNPSDEIDNFLVTFGSESDFYTDRSVGVDRPNRFMKGSSKVINQIINREADFLTNLNTVSMIVRAMNEGTHFNTVSRAFKKWMDAATDDVDRQLRREAIQAYPVFLVVSDGDLNNGRTATESMAQFQHEMLQWFGWSGVVVVWNVSSHVTNSTDYFAGLANVIHYYGYNAGIINTIFTKIHDLDVIDIFTPLKSIFESNRYELLRHKTL